MVDEIDLEPGRLSQDQKDAQEQTQHESDQYCAKHGSLLFPPVAPPAGVRAGGDQRSYSQDALSSL